MQFLPTLERRDFFMSLIFTILGVFFVSSISFANEVDIELIRRKQPLLYLNHIPDKSLDTAELEIKEMIEESVEEERVYFGKFLSRGVRITDKSLLLDGYEKLIENLSPTRKQVKELREWCEGKDVFCLSALTLDETNYMYQLYIVLKYNMVVAMATGRNASTKEYTNLIRAYDLIDWTKARDSFKNTTLHLVFKPGRADCSKRSVSNVLASAIGLTIVISPFAQCLKNNEWGNNVIHELGHILSTLHGRNAVLKDVNMYTNSSDWVEYAALPEWLKISNWKVLSRYHHVLENKSACFYSIYSRFDAHEDFAESFKFFIISPEYAYEKCPEKASVMKNILHKNK